MTSTTGTPPAPAAPAEIVLKWIAAARRRKLGNGTLPLLWLVLDDLEGVRKIPEAHRENVKSLLDEMRQTEEVKRVRKGVGL